MITDERMEKLIAELYEENIRDMEIDIDMEALIDKAYAEVEAREKERAAAARRKKFKSAVRAAVVFIGILVLSLAVFEPEQGYADVFRFMFDGGSNDNKVLMNNLLQDEKQEDVTETIVTMEELDETVGFDVPVPEYLPEGFNGNSEAKIVNNKEEVISIFIFFYEKEEWGTIMYNIAPAKQKRVQSIVMDIPEDEKEVIKINNMECYMYSDEEKEKTTIYWETDEYTYSIDGNISREEAIKIVASLE